MKRLLTISVLLSTAATVSAEAVEGPVRLTYRLAKNAITNYISTSELSQRFTMMNRTMNTTVLTNVDIKTRVTDNVLNHSAIAISFDKGSIRTTVKSEDDGVVQDTTTPLREINDLGITVSLSPNGATNVLSTTATTSPLELMLEMVRSTRILDGLFTEFPTKDVNVRDAWTVRMNDTTTAPQGLGEVITSGPVRMMYEGVIDTLGRSCWVITSRSSQLRQLGSFSRGDDISMSLSGVGTLVGRALHDVTTGELVTSNVEYNTNVTMEFRGRQRATIPVESAVKLIIHQPQTSKK